MSDFPDLPVVPAADSSLPGSVELGAFSVSLNVKDLAASRAFYEKLGFEATMDSSEMNYLIMKNGETTIGLFQGIIESNVLTFNPGLTNKMQRLQSFTDIRDVHSAVSAAGGEPDDLGVTEEMGGTDEAGPASFTVTDPDGNVILIDQFF